MSIFVTSDHMLYILDLRKENHFSELFIFDIYGKRLSKELIDFPQYL